jgi:hypothetical protein
MIRYTSGSPRNQYRRRQAEELRAYNDWALLWKFRLSWWGDVIPMLDDKNRLSVEQAQGLLEMLKQRENVFELKLAQTAGQGPAPLPPPLHQPPEQGNCSDGDRAVDPTTHPQRILAARTRCEDEGQAAHKTYPTSSLGLLAPPRSSLS